MPQCLSAEEAEYYATESNVVDYADKSEELFREIEQHFGFVGGSTEEYAAYFRRKDLPPGLWHFTVAEHVKAIAGFSAVGKKQTGRQRKLMMMCAANYVWSSARRRSDHGLHGGSAFNKVWIPSD